MLKDLTPPVLASWLVDAWREIDPRDAAVDPAAWIGAAERLMRRITRRAIAGPDDVPAHQWRLSPADLMALCRMLGLDPRKVTLAEFLARALPAGVDVAAACQGHLPELTPAAAGAILDAIVEPVGPAPAAAAGDGACGCEGEPRPRGEPAGPIIA